MILEFLIKTMEQKNKKGYTNLSIKFKTLGVNENKPNRVDTNSLIDDK